MKPLEASTFAIAICVDGHAVMLDSAMPNGGFLHSPFETHHTAQPSYDGMGEEEHEDIRSIPTALI